MRFDINSIIFFYMFICAALLVFNLGYILRSQGRNRRRERQTAQWQEELAAQWDAGSVSPAHRDRLARKLPNIRQLLAYYTALKPRLAQPEPPAAYLEAIRPLWTELAFAYRKRPAMERAFFAYVLSELPWESGSSQNRLAQLLLAFLDRSTVYCRENVLLALCALGNAGALERALERFQAEGWYHHPRLLSDGLAAFSGDRDAFARRLWKAAAAWSEPYQAAVVQFAAGLPEGGGPDLSREFREALTSAAVPQETRFALVRYFQRHPRPEALEPLLRLVSQETGEGGLAIAACAALGRYPSPESRQALKQALHSRNWYVRRNAASSLVQLGLSEEEQRQLAQDPDRYAREMYEYMRRR